MNAYFLFIKPGHIKTATAYPTDVNATAPAKMRELVASAEIKIEVETTADKVAHASEAFAVPLIRLSSVKALVNGQSRT